MALHWVIAVLVLAQVAWGWGMQAISKVPHGPRVDAFNLHKSVGLTILALMLVRLGWRLAHPAPGLARLPAWQRRAARATHGALYGALFVMPLAGYLGSAWSGYPVKWFGLTLPSWAAAHPVLKASMSELHLAASIVLVVALVLHIGAGAWHARRRDGYAARMWFGRGERRSAIAATGPPPPGRLRSIRPRQGGA